ncbi:MAG: ATP-dependent helicase HrpB [Acidobacteriota bacterium]|nr:ATP-dependent helicase HrpB [Acidobacteriota bacterium]
MFAKLPVDDAVPQILDALNSAPAVVLQAPTGTGKTTRVPPALLDAGILGNGRLMLLQPRRVAARACARTMARMRGEKVGDTVGYQIRFEKLISRKTRIAVVTEGILTRRFLSDPMLEDVTCVVLDEFHERSIHTDLALAFLRELLTIRDDLKVVVMSATLQAEPIARFLFDCPVVRVEARTHPLSIDYLSMPASTPQGELVEAGLKQLLADSRDDGGHVLVFLPGAPEIRRVQRYLARRNWAAEIVPLHGSLSSQEQDAALTPTERRRIILATNIAETSLTIEGVTAVIDSGLRKTLIHDAGRGVDRLDLVRVSQAGAVQRAGRAGRTGPGRVIRLWDEQRQVSLIAEDPPEISQADLAATLLQVLDFHGPDLDAFPFFEAPPETSKTRALETLQMLGAVDANHRLTERGRRLGHLPLHPRTGAILEKGAALGLVEEAAGLSALLSEKPLTRGDSDLWTQHRMITDWDVGDRLPEEVDRGTARRVRDTRKQLLGMARKLWPKGERGQAKFNRRALAGMLLAGYPDRLCRVREAGKALLVGGRGIEFNWAGGTPMPQMFLALELVEVSTNRGAARAGRIVPVTMDDVCEVLDVTRCDEVVFDRQREAVTAVRRVKYRDLVLEEKPGGQADPTRLAETLAEHAAARFDVLFRPDKKAAELLARLRFAARHMPELDWPDLSREGLLTMLPQLCLGKRRFDDLRKLDWHGAFLNMLDWRARSLLDKEAPERLEVPSGSMVRIDYEPALDDTGFPVLAVRLQELFGLADTPRLAKGRVPLLIHLLAPNMRPAQVTRDLRSFWNNTYADVRKELRQRYPKHSWPEDPWTAQAIRGVPRRKK